MAAHTRSGGPMKLKLERYAEALSDSSFGLTYPVFVSHGSSLLSMQNICLAPSWLLSWGTKATLLKPTALIQYGMGVEPVMNVASAVYNVANLTISF